MSRVIQTSPVGTERTRLAKSIVIAIRRLMHQNAPDSESLDLAAYIALALKAIDKTVEESVGAWEKRGYWVKADRFRMEWEWTKLLSIEMEQAVRAKDWAGVAKASIRIAEKLKNTNVPQRNRLGEPWQGAWKLLLGQSK